MQYKTTVLNAFLFFYKNKVQRVDQVNRKLFLWSVKAPYEANKFDQQVPLHADNGDLYRRTPYPINAQNNVKVFTPDNSLLLTLPLNK